MNKVCRFEIIKPLDCDWKLFGSILNTLQFDIRQILNKTMQLCWEYQGFSSEYKKKYGEYPNAKDILQYSNLMGYCYDRLKTEFNHHNSANYTTTVKSATDKWKKSVKDILSGKMSIPNYKKDVPIDIHNSCISIIKESDKYNANLSLLSNNYKKELGRKSGQICVALKAVDKSQTTILDRLISGEYKVSASKIIHYKNKWFLNLSYGFEVKNNDLLDPNKVMGVDMGVVYPAYMAFNDSFKRYNINGGEILSFRNKIEARRNQLLEQGKYCGDGRIGHGKKTRIRPIESIQNKVANFRNTTNNKYSKYIVDIAVENNCGIIQIEDLTGICKYNNFLKKWSYYDLQEKIKYKAEEKGIKVIKINPQYTSQRCSKCGYIHSSNRETQSLFECAKCGYKTNADYNAAKNISIPYIDEIIKIYAKENKLKYLTTKDNT